MSYSSWVPALARLLMRLFYRKVEVVGRHRIDPSRPLIYLANHNNALIDPALLVAFLPGRPRFLAKATLWKRAILRPFLSMAHVIPVHRRQDPGFDASHNEGVFRQCHEVLGQRGAVALFPEGRSHAEPSLGGLKTGAARIALGAAREFGIEVDLVPVGLVFESRDQFRSRVLVKVGEPLKVVPRENAKGEEEVREWTETFREALSALTLNYPSWEEARWIERAADLFRGERGGVPVEDSPDHRFEISQAFIEGYDRLARERPALLEELRGALREYDSLLGTWGVRDDHVASHYPWTTVTRFVLQTLLSLFILLPLALLGIVWNYVPYRLSGWVGAGVARQPDLPATYKLFAGMLFYPLAWVGIALYVGLKVHPLTGGIAFCLGPICGWAALFFRDRGGNLWRETKAFMRLVRYRDGWRALRERRRTLRERIVEQIQWVTEGSGE